MSSIRATGNKKRSCLPSDTFHIILIRSAGFPFVRRATLATFTDIKKFALRKFLNITLRVLLAVILLLVMAWGFLQTDWGQNWLARQVTGRLSRDLQTRISIDHVRFRFFNQMDLQGVLVEDQRRDTLLYAGSVQVRITDWFFLKDKAVLHYIGLENAVVHFNRTDSVWNYQFLQHYFASSPDKKQSAGIAFDLEQVRLRQVSFVQRDAWSGSDLTASVRALDLDAEDISLSEKNIDIRNISLVDPVFSTTTYAGKRGTPGDSTASLPPGEGAWTFRVAKASIRNGRYRTNDLQTVARAGVFQTQHLDFTAINGNLANIGWAADTIRGQVDLSARERSGLEVKQLKAKTTFHSAAMIFDELLLKTNRSTIGNYFSMRYPNGMENFIHDVVMEGRFSDARIASDDIAFFAPETASWNRAISITGHVKGTVDDLSARDLEVWAGNKTYISGHVSIVGLPDINKAFINLETEDLRTTYADAVNFIPALRKVTTPDLRALSYLRFRGTYTGFLNDFVSYGTIETPLGTLRTDLNVKTPARGLPSYSGAIATSGFQLGRFLGNPQLGIVDFSGRVKGRGLEWKNLDLNIDGLVRRFEYNGYTYRNINAHGVLRNRMFNGDFVMKDPYADVSISGLIDFREDVPLFNARADIRKINLAALGFSKEPLELSGHFDLDLQGNSLATLLGNARIMNATLLHNGNRLSFDSLIVSSRYVDGLKILQARSNEFDATITGNFDLQGLPDAFTLFLSRYYPSYIRAPRNVVPQTFTFDITTGVVEDYIKLIDPRLSGFNNSHLTGSLNTVANTMTIDADVPYFTYEQYQFSNIQLKGSGNLEKLVLTGEVNDAVLSSTVRLPQTSFTIEAQDDVSEITVNTTANQTINQASLSARINTFSDGATIVFNPSSFILNGKNWSIEQGGELNFRTNTVVQGQLLLKESQQEIQISTQPSAIGNWNDLHIALRNLNLGDLSPLLLPDNRLEGLLHGDIVIEDPQHKLNVTALLHTDELRLDNDSLGQVEARLAYNNRTGMLTGEGQNADPDHHIDFDLSMDLKDTANTFQDRISLHPRNFQLSILERFLGNLFSDIRGYLTGDIDILGEGASRDYIARARLSNARFKVNFTQVSYLIEDTDIELLRDRIVLDGIRLRDTLGNLATVRGNIRHQSFANLDYDIVVQTQSNNMMLLQTGYNDNEQFYGLAKGSGTFVLTGPQNNMFMNIDIRASQTDSSYITLPPSRTQAGGQAGFMVEKKYGTEMNPDVLRGQATNLKYQITLAANPMVNMEVVLDELTGDIIRGRGTGILTLNSGTTTPLTINGRYEIEDGSYLFTFQSFFKKPFVLRRGANNYIEWNGDPYKANINLEAIYTAENVSFAPLANTLLSSSNAGTSLARFRDDVNVVATLTGELFQPTFQFRLEFPSNSLVYRDPSVSFGIQQIEKNTNELNKQVTYLIVFNSFAPYENTQTNASNPFGEAISSTISGLLFGEVNRRINELLSKVLRQSKFTLNLTGSFYNRNLINQGQRGLLRINQSDFNISVGKSLLDGRLNFTVGGTFDVPIQSDFQQDIRLFPDVTVELWLNKTGSVRASFFYRENADFLSATTTASPSQTRRYGASVSYGKEFDSFTELLSGNRKKGRGNLKPQPDTSRQVADSTVAGQ